MSSVALSSSTIPAGITAEVVGTLFIITSVTCLKHFDVGLFYELALMLTGIFVPACLVMLYYRHTSDKTRFAFSDLFTDRARLNVGVYTFGYFLCTYCSYRLLPLTIAMPIYVTYPVMDILLSAVINKTPMPDGGQWVGIAVLLAGVATFLYDATSTAITPSVVCGIVLGFVGALSVALRMIYTAHRPVMGAPVRPTHEVKRDHPEHHPTAATEASDAPTEGDKPLYVPSPYHLSIQMLETSTVGMLLFAALAVAIACVPESWLTYCTDVLEVPKSLLSRSTDGGWKTLLVMFGVYVVFTCGGNTLLVASDDMLPTNLFACLVYTAVLFSMLSGYFVLGESVSAAEVVGMVLVIVGGVGVVWRKRDRRRVAEADASAS